MIFIDEYNGDESTLYTDKKFKEFTLKLPGAYYTARSMQLIYEMYCNWLKTRNGFYLFEVKLSVADSLGVCSESMLDCLFHRVQGDIKYLELGADKSIGFISNTYRLASSTIHNGYFLLPMSEAAKINSKRGEKAEIPEDVHRVFKRILNSFYCDSFCHEDIFKEDELDLSFTYSTSGEGSAAIFNDSSFEMHEEGFNRLCEIAELPIERKHIESSKFRAWHGYIPHHDYFCTSLFESFFFYF
jgi:hypothetical protein